MNEHNAQTYVEFLVMERSNFFMVMDSFTD